MIGEGSVLDGRYRLERLLGRGGFAQVFQATHLLLQRPVAVKLLRPDLASQEDERSFLEDFAREARTVAALNHDHILSVTDYGEVEGTAYLVMPLVTGGTIHDRIRREGRLSLQQAGAYLRQVAAALDYAHGRQPPLVHRDIKPQNMLLRAEDDRLLLADFGIAKVLGTASTHSSTRVMGTLVYMAPEQFHGQVLPATDIYALGCTLFEMLTGEPPYSGPTQQVIYSHLMAPIPSIAERSRGRLPAGLQEVIDRALAKKPEERFRSAGELAGAFEAAGARIIAAGSTTTPTLAAA
ncbi:MAG: serine/threonine protein kinase, partial [Chloroflexota bacterium]|nr:serine/threonine protein kinase [Chloroflexota bacterium]